MRGSYSGNTLAFQANAESSILLPRSTITKELNNIKTGDTTSKEVFGKTTVPNQQQLNKINDVFKNKEFSIQICKTRFPYIDSIEDKEVQKKVCSWGQSPAGKYLLSQPEDSREKVLDDLDKRNGDEETRKIKKEIRQALGMKADTLLGRMFSKNQQQTTTQNVTPNTPQLNGDTKINISGNPTFTQKQKDDLKTYLSDPKNVNNLYNSMNQQNLGTTKTK